MKEITNQPTLAELLRELRNEAGLSLYELANQSGVGRAKLHRIEHGEIKQPTTSTLNKLARALHVDPEDFYDAVWQDTDEPLPSPAAYFRHKYHLSDQQIQELEAAVERITGLDHQDHDT